MRHDEIELAVGGLVDLVDCANVRVVQSRCRFGLLEEPLLGDLVPCQVGWQELDRDVAIQPGVMRQVHDAHAALAELRHDAVGPELATGLYAILPVACARPGAAMRTTSK